MGFFKAGLASKFKDEVIITDSKFVPYLYKLKYNNEDYLKRISRMAWRYL